MNPKTNSFKVFQASAGSGKTYTIVKEYLELCLKSPEATSNFSQILAITFTNLAANEMKAKIIRHLNEILHSDPQEEAKGMEADLLKDLGIERSQLKENASLLFRNIIHDYSSFCVSTIDAFVQKLSRSFAKELNLPTQFSVSIDKNEVADSITERIGKKIGPEHPYLTKILEDYYGLKFDDERSPKVVDSIHDYVIELFSEKTFQQHEQNLLQSEQQYQKTKDFLDEKTKDFAQQIQPFVKEYEDFIAKYQLTNDDFKFTNGPCLGFLKIIKTKQYEPLGVRQSKLISGNDVWYSDKLKKKAGSALSAMDKEFQEKLLPYLTRYQQELVPYLYYHQQLNQLSLYSLRSLIKAEMDDYIDEELMVPISEFNKRINDMMGDFSVPFIYERIGEHFTHLFIDEFQDTSVLQWQNLVPLLDNSLANNNMSMVVGDGKQSIYRWRNGEVGQIVSLPNIFKKPDEHEVFDDIENNLINHFDFTELKSNYRSFSNIVDFNNQFFKYCIDNDYLSEEKRKVYVDKDERFNKEVSVKQLFTKEHEGFIQVELFPDQRDKASVLERLLNLVGELLEHGFALKDIAILVRSNKIGSLIANHLNENGIPVVSAESILLKNSYKVQLILHTLDYLIHSSNKAVIANVLYYWHSTHDQANANVMNGLFDRVGDIAKGNRSLEEELGLKSMEIKTLLFKSYSLYDLCSALMRIYGFNTLGDSHLNYLLDLVHRWQQTNEAGIESFLTYWKKNQDSLSVLSSQSDAVNVMTIHKSKGLEFNVVIYPFMNDDIDDTKNNNLWIPSQATGFEAIPNIDKVLISLSQKTSQWTPQLKDFAEEEAKSVRLDNLNLTYVAFTRPKQRLHVLSFQSKDKDLDKSPLNAFLKDHQKNKGGEPEKGAYDQAIYCFGDPQTPKVEEHEVEIEKAELFHDSKACDWSEKVAIDPNPSMFWISGDNKMQPQEWGDFVHQVLSEVRHANDIDRALLPYLDAGVIDTSTAEMLKGLFEKMVQEPLIQQAFSPEAKVKNECEVYSPVFGIRRPDRYAELSDVIYLLDYKTGKKTEDHPKQLQEYRSVLKNIVHKEIRAFLVYLGDTLEVIPVN